MSAYTAPEPDEVTAGWWDATREHRLVVQHCAACGALQHPPRAVCIACGRMDAADWVPAAGTGVVDSWTVVHRSPQPGHEPPYTIARVRLDEGVLLLTRLEGPTPWRIGDRVEAIWVGLDDGRALPVFRRAEHADR